MANFQALVDEAQKFDELVVSRSKSIENVVWLATRVPVLLYAIIFLIRYPLALLSDILLLPSYAPGLKKWLPLYKKSPFIISRSFDMLAPSWFQSDRLFRSEDFNYFSAVYILTDRILAAVTLFAVSALSLVLGFLPLLFIQAKFLLQKSIMNNRMDNMLLQSKPMELIGYMESKAEFRVGRSDLGADHDHRKQLYSSFVRVVKPKDFIARMAKRQLESILQNNYAFDQFEYKRCYLKYSSERNAFLSNQYNWSLAKTILSGLFVIPLLITIPAHLKLQKKLKGQARLMHEYQISNLTPETQDHIWVCEKSN